MRLSLVVSRVVFDPLILTDVGIGDASFQIDYGVLSSVLMKLSLVPIFNFKKATSPDVCT